MHGLHTSHHVREPHRKRAIDDHWSDRSLSHMIHQRAGDDEAFKKNQRNVVARTEQYLESIDPAGFQRVRDAFEPWHDQDGLSPMG